MDPVKGRCTTPGSCAMSSSSHYSLPFRIHNYKTTKQHACPGFLQNDDQTAVQNMFNKRNEKLNKPCQNGFCYCFTSDSDEIKFSHNQPKHRTRFKKPMGVDYINLKLPENKTNKRVSLPPETKTFAKDNVYRRSCGAEIPKTTTIYKDDVKSTSCSDLEAPMLHIIQEIHKDVIISEVRINKSKVKWRRVRFHKRNNSENQPVQEVNGDNPPHVKSDSEDSQLTASVREDVFDLNDFDSGTLTASPHSCKRRNDTPSSGSSRKKGGDLLRKRLTPEKTIKYTNSNTPPKKPPRSFSSGSEQNQTKTYIPTTERNLEQNIIDMDRIRAERNLEQNIINMDRTQAYVSEHWNKSAAANGVKNSMPLNIPEPTCPTISLIEMESFREQQNKMRQNQQSEWIHPEQQQAPPQQHQTIQPGRDASDQHGNNNGHPMPQSAWTPPSEQHESPKEDPIPQVGWVPPDIVNMIHYESRSDPKMFKSSQYSAEPQSLGWVPPPKLNIDTVDAIPKFRTSEDFHNFAANMECKSTPIKNEILISKDVNEQSKRNIINESGQKEMLNTRLSNIEEEEKIKSLSKKESFSKKAVDNTINFLENSKRRIIKLVRRNSRRRSMPTLKSIGIQTSNSDLTDGKYPRKLFFDETKSISNNSQNQKPSASETSKETPKQNFDFNRVVPPPRKDKNVSNKFGFSPGRVFKSITPQRQNIPQSYRSYASDLNSDLTVATMNDILGSIRDKLEKNDDQVPKTFQECVNYASVQQDDTSTHNSIQFPAQVDIHQEPVYAEIPQYQQHFAAVSTASSMNGVQHIIVNENPSAIYAEVRKKCRQITKSQSFNNLLEKDRFPQERNLSKSQLSNSDIFLDNLFDSKKDNSSGQYKRANTSLDSIEDIATNMPLRAAEQSIIEITDCEDSFEHAYCNSPLRKSDVEVVSPSPKSDRNDIEAVDLPDRSSSCPLPLKDEDQFSNNSKLNTSNDTDIMNTTIPNLSKSRYTNIKKKLRVSFRKSKIFLKKEKKRLSDALDKSITKIEDTVDASRNILRKNDKLSEQNDLYSNLCMSQNDTSNDPIVVKRQLEQAVNICRQMPQFESSTELVEAERLLLYSSLKSDSLKKKKPGENVPKNNICRLNVNSLRIPIKPDAHLDTFFNYFYIGVFSNGAQIISTHSVERRNDEVIFQDEQMSFVKLEANFEIKVDIYVLRLRKLTGTRPSKPARKKTIYSSSDSGEELFSRFRLHGSLMLTASSFVPYSVDVERQQLPADKICLYAYNENFILPLNVVSRRKNIFNDITIGAQVEIYFDKFAFEGFLNVEDPKNSWNRRWCRLNAFILEFWDYPQDFSEKPPVFIIDLAKVVSYPIEAADRDTCPRPRCFVIKLLNDSDNEKTFRFSADNCEDLNYWLTNLNNVGEFLLKWT